MKLSPAYRMKISLLGVLISAAIELVDELTSLTMPPVLHIFNGFYFLLALISHMRLLSANQQSGSRFVTAFMGLVTIKLLLTLAVLGTYLYLNKEHQKEVAITVFVIYMSYTILEVWTMQSELRRK